MRNNDYQENAIYLPAQFKPTYLSHQEASVLIFSKELGRWINEDIKNSLENSKYNMYIAKINADLLEKYVDFKSAARLVELLEAIPNFKIRLTPEEKDVIGTSGNVLAIGRSGTGKTTCAILRLFSMEILFKVRVTQAKLKNESILRDTRFNSDDIDNAIGLHCIFVTASPVLTNEVCRYYHRLTDQIKEELKKKEQRIKEKKKKEQEELKKKTQEEVAEENAKKEKEEANNDHEIITSENTAENQIKEKLNDVEEEIKIVEEHMKDIAFDKESITLTFTLSLLNILYS